MFSHWNRTYGSWLRTLETWGVRWTHAQLSLSQQEGHLAYTYFEVPTAQGCILLLHGTGNDALFGWELWIEHLLKAGYAVLAVDLEGHGSQSSHLLDPVTFTHSARLISSCLIDRGWAAERLIVCGYSLGGLFAIKALAQGELCAAKLILVALPTHIKISWQVIWQEFTSIFQVLFWQQVFSRGWRATLPALGAWRRQDFPLRLKNFSQASYPQSVAELFQLYRPQHLIPQLDLPILFIYGEKDYIAPPLALQTLLDLSKNSSFLLIARANHFLLLWHRQACEEALHWLGSTNETLSEA